MEQNIEEGSQKQKCHLFQIMAIIGKKWTIAILQQIDINGYKGYNFMLKELGKISSKEEAFKAASKLLKNKR